MKSFWAGLVFFVAFLVGAFPASGGSLSESTSSSRPRESLPVPIFSFRLDSPDTAASAPSSFSFQQQPFVVKPVRLRDDDPVFSKKSPWWAVALSVVSTNVFVWAVDRYVFNYSWSHIGPASWKNNFQMGCEWDTDRIGMNFFFHPLSGAAFFNSARARGYRYFASIPFALFGSLTWEYFGETTRPAYNDLINTTVSGALIGEIIYRLTSNILDDRTTGGERFFRELGAAILSPGRAFNRLLQGKMSRVTLKEIYQKEPINIALAVGAHWFNKGTTFGTGSTSAIVNIHLDYGDPFEIRARKPFDFFKARLDLSYGKNVGKKYLDNVIGYGLLFGQTVHTGKLKMLIGAFQHYNFWDSKIFEVGAMSFGGGIVARAPLSENSHFQIAIHLGLVPLAASNSPYIDIIEEGVHLRNYDYSGGGDAKFEGTLNIGKLGQVTAIYYVYWLQTYIGPSGYKNIEVFKPRIAVHLFDNLSLGFEYLYYHKDSYYRDFPDAHKSNSEQKLYLMLYF